jgi:hypothetical protein
MALYETLIHLLFQSITAVAGRQQAGLCTTFSIVPQTV